MYKTFVDFRDKGKQYFYEGNDIAKAMRAQAELIKKYKNNSEVESIGYESANNSPESALEQGKTIKGRCIIHR